MLALPGLDMGAAQRLFISLLIISTMAWTGCGPKVQRDELGEVIFEVPLVTDADEPYRLPDPVEPSQPPPTTDQ